MPAKDNHRGGDGREPDALRDARAHLAEAEATLMSANGLFHLQEGIAALEASLDRDPRVGQVASNIGRTYVVKVYERVREKIAAASVPEPVLEHLFALVRAFDNTSFEPPADARAVKVEVVRRLVDLYYEGYPAADKERAYEQLANLSRSNR